MENLSLDDPDIHIKLINDLGSCMAASLKSLDKTLEMRVEACTLQLELATHIRSEIWEIIPELKNALHANVELEKIQDNGNQDSAKQDAAK